MGFRDAFALIKSVMGVMCLDCDENTIDIREYYVLKDDVWAARGGEPDGGMLCIGCVEKRLRRRLQPDDFTDAPINRAPFSSRLRARLEEETAA